jgi:DNA primase catalytic core
MLHENVDFPAALRMLAERAHIRLEWEAGEAGPGAKEALYRLHTEVADLFHRGLLKSPLAAAARAYLETRALTADIVADFGIGYAPERWDMLVQWTREKGYAPEQVAAAGLIIESDRPDAGRRYYDRFRNRLMFPIRDERGRVIAFSGRALDAADQGAKYVNSPETPLFRKSAVLYALDKARHHIVETREAILCEGQIDVIRCHHCGFPTAVAAQGTAFTDDHARILKRYADGVLLVFDPDRAGQDAALRATAVFMQAGMAARVAVLPPGEDPDAFLLKRGAEAFRKILAEAAEAIEFQSQVLAGRENLRSEIGLQRAETAVLQTISQAPTAAQREHLLNLAAQRLNIPPPDLQRDFARLAAPRHRAALAAPAAPEPDASAVPPEEFELAVHLAALPELADLLARYLPLDMIGNDICRNLLAALLESRRANADVMALLAERDDAQRRLTALAAKVFSSPSKAGTGEVSLQEAAQELIAFIWRRELKRQRTALERQLLSTPPAAGTGLRKDIADLTRDINALQRWETAGPIIDMHRHMVSG